ncbi:transposase [Micrococcus luteus]|uniref:transposase n=1 Tax=Micrococcus luteus TaxID=1270 RepID=UPI0033E2A512
MKTLTITAPEPLRDQLRHLSTHELITTCAALRPDPARIAEPCQAAKAALRALARHHDYLSEQITELDALIQPLVAAINPRLLQLNGVGVDVAGQLLVTAGQNPQRIRSEAAFAMLCGVAPIPASSGQTHRYRLNRGGDRQANSAIHRIVICRLRWDPRTRTYMNRRTTEGLSKKDIIRCLKRLITREIYHALTTT